MGLAQQSHASSHYDEWWVSIILTWKHPLLFWLGVANEGCIAKLPFYLSTHFSTSTLSYLLSHCFPPLFLCQCALWVLSSGPCNTQTSCREENLDWYSVQRWSTSWWWRREEKKEEWMRAVIYQKEILYYKFTDWFKYIGRWDSFYKKLFIINDYNTVQIIASLFESSKSLCMKLHSRRAEKKEITFLLKIN